jgi:hypothetical protein
MVVEVVAALVQLLQTEMVEMEFSTQLLQQRQAQVLMVAIMLVVVVDLVIHAEQLQVAQAD